MNLINFILLAPELYFLNSIIALLWLGTYLKIKNVNTSYTSWLSPITCTTVFCILAVTILFCRNPAASFTASNGYLAVTPLEVNVKLAILLSSVFILLVTLDSKRAFNFSAVIENILLKTIIIFALLIVTCSNDMFILFFSLEIYALSSYILVGQRGATSIFSSEAGLKYMILGTVFSLILGYGIALLYSTSGLTNLTDLTIFHSTGAAVLGWKLGTFFVATGLLFKLAAAPYHFWSPDVYEGSPTTTMFFLSVVPKIALFTILIKLYSVVFINSEVYMYFIICAILSILIGSLGGIFQKRIKRLLAYSMIANTGYMLLLLGTATHFSISTFFFFLFIYIVTLVGVFAVFLSNRVEPSKLLVKNLFGLVNNFYINSPKSVLFSFFLFSSAALPPFAGFLAKFLALISLFSPIVNISALTVLILVLTSLSVFYYIRIIKVMGFYKRKFWLFFSQVGFYSGFTMAVAFVAIVILFVVAGSLFNIILILITTCPVVI